MTGQRPLVRADVATVEAWIRLDEQCGLALQIGTLELGYALSDDPAAILAGAEKIAATAARYCEAVRGVLGQR